MPNHSKIADHKKKPRKISLRLCTKRSHETFLVQRVFQAQAITQLFCVSCRFFLRIMFSLLSENVFCHAFIQRASFFPRPGRWFFLGTRNACCYRHCRVTAGPFHAGRRSSFYAYPRSWHCRCGSRTLLGNKKFAPRKKRIKLYLYIKPIVNFFLTQKRFPHFPKGKFCSVANPGFGSGAGEHECLKSQSPTCATNVEWALLWNELWYNTFIVTLSQQVLWDSK